MRLSGDILSQMIKPELASQCPCLQPIKAKRPQRGLQNPASAGLGLLTKKSLKTMPASKRRILWLRLNMQLFRPTMPS